MLNVQGLTFFGMLPVFLLSTLLLDVRDHFPNHRRRRAFQFIQVKPRSPRKAKTFRHVVDGEDLIFLDKHVLCLGRLEKSVSDANQMTSFEPRELFSAFANHFAENAASLYHVTKKVTLPKGESMNSGWPSYNEISGENFYREEHGRNSERRWVTQPYLQHPAEKDIKAMTDTSFCLREFVLLQFERNRLQSSRTTAYWRRASVTTFHQGNSAVQLLTECRSREAICTKSSSRQFPIIHFSSRRRVWMALRKGCQDRWQRVRAKALFQTQEQTRAGSARRFAPEHGTETTMQKKLSRSEKHVTTGIPC